MSDYNYNLKWKSNDNGISNLIKALICYPGNKRKLVEDEGNKLQLELRPRRCPLKDS